jgi:hypothetical protein
MGGTVYSRGGMPRERRISTSPQGFARCGWGDNIGTGNTKKAKARRHQFLPVSYLKRFTDFGSESGKFYVFEMDSGETFLSKPQSVAVERDFNRIDIEGYPTDYIEQLFSSMENDANNAISNIEKSGEFPFDENYSAILHLICLIAVRNTFFRKSVNSAKERMIRLLNDALAADDQLLRNKLIDLQKSESSLDDNILVDEIKEFFKSGEYEVKFHPQDDLRSEMKIFEKMLHILHERIWSVVITPSGGPEFICSDHPAGLGYKHRRNGYIGLASRYIELFFPLSRNIGLYGTYEDSLKPVFLCKAG